MLWITDLFINMRVFCVLSCETIPQWFCIYFDNNLWVFASLWNWKLKDTSFKIEWGGQKESSHALPLSTADANRKGGIVLSQHEEAYFMSSAGERKNFSLASNKLNQ